jgi:5-methyltetrahydropteroyltriglutamate--homocysteine methyltransferase
MIKMTVPGPFTMSQQAQNDFYKDEEEMALDYANAVNAEIKDLFAAGADIVQIDEPYMQARPEKARKYGLKALNAALDGVKGPTAVHICFGYAAIIHVRPEGYSFLPELSGSPVNQVSIETAQSKLDCSVLEKLPGKTIILGTLDLSDMSIEKPETVAAAHPPRAEAHSRPSGSLSRQIAAEIFAARRGLRKNVRHGRRRGDRPCRIDEVIDTDGRYDLSNLARRLLSAAGLAHRSRALVEDGAARAHGRSLAGRSERARSETGRGDAVLRSVTRNVPGLDIITDGEQRRESYSNRFATALEGVDTENPGSTLNRSGKPIPVPRVTGKVRRKHPVQLRDLQFLRANTKKTIKMTVPGPFTMSKQAQNEFYKSDEAMALDYAAAVNEEIKDLFAAGADIVQIDEPWMQQHPEKAREYGLKALDRALDGVTGTVAVHLCFGYAAVVHDKPTGYSFLPELEGSRAAQVSIEAAQPKLDLKVLEKLPSKTIILGVIDLSDLTVETPEVVRGAHSQGAPICAGRAHRDRP